MGSTVYPTTWTYRIVPSLFGMTSKLSAPGTYMAMS